MEWDPIKKMREWIIETSVATPEELDKLCGRSRRGSKGSKKKRVGDVPGSDKN